MSQNTTRDYPHFIAPKEDLFPWVVAVLLIGKLILARYLVFGGAFGPGALSDMLVVFALMGLSMGIGGPLGRRVLGVTAFGGSLAVLGTVLYASFFNQIPSLGMLGMIGQAGGLGEDVGNLFSWRHVLFVADLPFIMWAAFFRPAAPLKTSRRARPALVGTSALLGFFAFVVAAYANGSAIDSLQTSYDHGIAAFQVSTFVSPREPVLIEPQEPGAAQLVQERIDELTLHRKGVRRAGAPMPGAMSGYNLVMIQAEALQDGLIGARINGEPVMPNLEAIIRDSIYFPNTYAQTGRGNTSDAEFIVNTSLYPGVDQPAALAYARKEVPSLPRLFKDAGYEAYTFHTNDVRFWNRVQMYPAIGFTDYFDKRWFGTEDITRYGSSDRILFEKVSFKLLDEAMQGTRFYAHVITMSAHYPYTAVSDRGTLKLPDNVKNTQTGHYLQSQSYFDAQLGDFMTQLRADGTLGNTVIVIYGDHFGMRFGDETEAERQFRKKIVGHGYNRADYLNVPLVIRLPEAEAAGRYEEVLGQIDIMPTIADLFGLDMREVPHFGRSAFVETPTVMTRGADPSIYIDGDTLYVSSVSGQEDRRYVSSSQEKIAPGKRPQRLATTELLLELSDSYASQLPERPDASDEVGYIPRAAQEPPR